MTDVYAVLNENRDEKYAEFQRRITPTVAPERMIGVRVPILRKLAKTLAKEPDIDGFLTALPHRTYDEDNLHGFIISECKDYDRAVAYVDAFLPYVDNWATCDLLSPKAFGKNKSRLMTDIDRWLASSETYTVRFGIEMLMSHFLDEDFTPGVLEKVAAVRSGEYYIRMIVAWFFATALAKQWDATLPLLTGCRLESWTHNKTIQKAVESYRITDEQKALLRSLKV